MTVPIAWAALTAYAAGALVNGTAVTSTSFVCTTAGTSGATEPVWTNRYPVVVDGTARWAPYSVLTPTQLRAKMNWTTATGQYSDDNIGNYLLDAISTLEHATQRYIVNHPGASLSFTSMVRATLPIPAIRTATSVTYAGATLGVGAYWLLPDASQSGVFTGISFRPFRAFSGAGIPGTPYGPWISNSNWFDQAADSPFYPANYGGGYAFASMPNDTVIVGTWGWEPGFEPPAAVHAIEVLGAFYALRAPTLLAETAVTPQGGIISYADLPQEARNFITSWYSGPGVVSIG